MIVASSSQITSVIPENASAATTRNKHMRDNHPEDKKVDSMQEEKKSARGTSDVIHKTADCRLAQMFSFSSGPLLRGQKHRKAFIRATLPTPSEWLHDVSLDSVGSSNVLHLKSSDGSLYDVGVEFAAGQGVLRRTIMITFYPHITFVNRLPLPIQL